jgi:two-component system phosphate regulon sensor histidine kinase PhoR
MIVEHERRIAALVAERNEQSAVLASMVEGVLAIDGRERVMAVNAAAARLLDVDAAQARGRTIHEVARNSELRRFVAEALAADAPLERDVVLHGDEPRFLQAHGAPVRDAAGARMGAVVVLNDVTRLRRLETVQRDFVANVSHELKTPVTSIKGFLETLLRGAMDEPANAKRFLEIVARQADRLGAIIDDMLLLSRIDQDREHPATEPMPIDIETIVRGAADVCQLKADQKGVALELACAEGLRARINPALVEQALVNLIDNAIKFSEAGSVVGVSTVREDGMVSVHVRDRGTGIEAEHLPRLFERFYRVDKARSRSLGGTGLGLAIVRHIAESQGGSIDVESKPGAGSTFTLRFPLA